MLNVSPFVWTVWLGFETRKAVLVGPSTDRLYRTNLAEVEAGKKERLEALRRQTLDKYKEVEEAGKGEFRLHATRNTLDALREEVKTPSAKVG